MMKRVALSLFALAVSAGAACSTDSSKTADTAAVATGDTTMPPPAATMSPEPVATAPTPSAGSSMDPNSASAADLATIRGVTTAMATAIVAGRPYKTIVAVDKALGTALDEKQRDSVYTRLWIPVDLNTATDAEILLIPGVGPRMLREFKEYRPWTSIDQFRREIGKYVDKAEVARLEKYVTIK
ncbi:MAG: hypothetical protein ABI681_07735 [Gemmatimonadales bacterium]